MTIPSKTKSLALHSRFLPWYVSGLLLRNGSLSLSLSRHWLSICNRIQQREARSKGSGDDESLHENDGDREGIHYDDDDGGGGETDDDEEEEDDDEDTEADDHILADGGEGDDEAEEGSEDDDDEDDESEDGDDEDEEDDDEDNSEEDDDDDNSEEDDDDEDDAPHIDRSRYYSHGSISAGEQSPVAALPRFAGIEQSEWESRIVWDGGEEPDTSGAAAADDSHKYYNDNNLGTNEHTSTVLQLPLGGGVAAAASAVGSTPANTSVWSSFGPDDSRRTSISKPSTTSPTLLFSPGEDVGAPRFVWPSSLDSGVQKLTLSRARLCE